MIKTFFVLWIWTGLGSTQTLAIDHFPTKEECYAARAAILANTNITPRHIECFEATILPK